MSEDGDAELMRLRASGLSIPPLNQEYRARPSTILVVAPAAPSDSRAKRSIQTAELIARESAELGCASAIVSEMGADGRADYGAELVDGIVLHRIPGPSRGARPIGEWATIFATRLAAVVRKARPAAIVAVDDEVGVLAASEIAERYGIAFAVACSPGSRPPALPEAVRLVLVRDVHEHLPRPRGPEPTRALIKLDRLGLAQALELLDAVPTGTSSIAALDVWPTADRLRAALSSSRTPLGKIAVMGGGRTSAREVMQDGWRDGDLAPVSITATLDWREACLDNRSQGFHLHSWDFIVPVLASWRDHGDHEVMTWALDRATEWCAAFADGEAHGTMAWYDMALGLRAPRLAYLLQEAVHESADDRIVEALGHAVVLHQRALFAPRSFNARTNHGFYTAVGQGAFARRLSELPGMSVLRDQAAERLRTVMTTQFAADGGHLEHSPDYHRMLLGSFRDAQHDGLIEDPSVLERLAKAEEVLGWFIRPDRTIVQFGDSPAREMRKSITPSSPHTTFLTSGGEEGQPNPAEVVRLPDSGYAMVRSPQPRASGDHRAASHLVLAASFHSRTHKHCDDLSLTWFDGGEELLIDAGRFGYLDPLPRDSPLRARGFFYSRPERQYVESALAHNTARADRCDHDRMRPPYGSGIVDAVATAGGFRLVGEVDHGHWRHERIVQLAPGRALVIEDLVHATDGRAHDFDVWWNLPGDAEMLEQTPALVSWRMGGGTRLTVVRAGDGELVAPVRGQEQPLRGWRSRADYELTPAWSLGHRAEAVGTARFVTRFELEARSLGGSLCPVL